MSRESHQAEGREGGVFHAVTEKFHEMRDVHEQLDKLFYSHAHEVGREIQRIGNIARGAATVMYPDVKRFKSEMKYPV